MAKETQQKENLPVTAGFGKGGDAIWRKKRKNL
jgi:hypothetical protein